MQMDNPPTRDQFSTPQTCPTTITHVGKGVPPLLAGAKPGSELSHGPAIAKGAPPKVKSVHPAPYGKSV